MPTLLVLWLVWLPAIGSVLLSFTNWDGIGPISDAKVGRPEELQRHRDDLPAVLAGVQHNLIWLAVMFLVATPFGMFLAVLLDREVRGDQDLPDRASTCPVVLSLALVGFIWQLIYSRDQGLINQVTGSTIDWYGDQRYNLWAALVASSWRHVGYIMLLYLAGLKGVDPSLREAAKVDGARRAHDVLQGGLPGHGADQHHRPGRDRHRVAARLRPGLGHQQGPQRPRAHLDPGHQQHRRGGEPDRLRLGAGDHHAADLVVFVVIYLRIVMREQR